jgi:hypothetical protein
MKDCYMCGAHDRELRPYGLNRQWVCFTCAFSTPEAEAAAKAAFDGQMATVVAGMKPGQVVVLGVGDEGPKALYPAQLQDALGGLDDNSSLCN